MMEVDRMACPKCYKAYIRVEGNTLICSCGYRETMTPRVPTYAELSERIKELEAELERKDNAVRG